ncbi:unnamed protein product [Acanthosepion pharaonis]|uniref:Uncharacterized protein n=1 Tax=Acanthosepion pharaonis TaxID=158019 RepID=A0A812BUK0_ACAPH|nr:unnamed protein product [Sepia pharaonis]
MIRKEKPLFLLQPTLSRNVSSFNLVAVGQKKGRLIPFSSQQNKIAASISDSHLLMDFVRIPCRFKSSQTNRPSVFSRCKLSDCVDTEYGIPATLKEVALCKQIIDSVIYEDQDLIAFNKPLGIHVFGQTVPGQEDELGYGVPIYPDLPPQTYACIADIMPMLRQHFQCPNLQITHSIKVFYAGVLIMAKNTKAKDAVIQALDRSKSMALPYQTYLAVTYGIPQIEGFKESTLYLVQKKHQGELLSFPCPSASKTKRKHGLIQKVNIRCNVLKRNNTMNCALVRFDTSKDKCHSTEVFATQELCSILGDYLYSSRVAKISHIPVKVEPHLAEVGKQKLPSLLKNILRLNHGEQMPLHLYRAKVDLRNFWKKSTLSIVAPYPSYFATTLRKLNLELPFEDIFKNDIQNG